jgi:hypothetical protein
MAAIEIPTELQELAAAFITARPRLGRNRIALNRLAERRYASGLCQTSSRVFARFCQARDVEAACSDWLSPRALGYDAPDVATHCVCLVSLDDGTWIVDWTGAQYQAAEFPRIFLPGPETL